MKYLMDANTFIEAKNRYYSMKVCPGYWSWIIANGLNEKIISIDHIKAELCKGNDELSEWAKDNSQIFLDSDDPDTQERYKEVAAYANTLDMKEGALEEFLSVGDSWLIAKALTIEDCVIVTHERKNPGIKRKILIPNVCEYFEQSYIDTFELLEMCEAEFILAA